MGRIQVGSGMETRLLGGQSASGHLPLPISKILSEEELQSDDGCIKTRALTNTIALLRGDMISARRSSAVQLELSLLCPAGRSSDVP